MQLKEALTAAARRAGTALPDRVGLRGEQERAGHDERLRAPADNYRTMHDEVDLVDLAAWLAETPCRVSSPGDVAWPQGAQRALLG